MINNHLKFALVFVLFWTINGLSAQDLSKKAQKLYKKQDYKAVVQLLESKSNYSPKERIVLGKSFYQLEDYKNASYWLEMSSRSSVFNAANAETLSIAQAKNGQCKDAKSTINRFQLKQEVVESICNDKQQVVVEDKTIELEIDSSSIKTDSIKPSINIGKKGTGKKGGKVVSDSAIVITPKSDSIPTIVDNKEVKENIPKDSSVVKVKKHSPKKAAILSSILPGLGQSYNKKYWKVPIVYAALGGLGYLALDNRKLYRQFKTAYRLRTDGDSTTVDEFDGLVSDAGLKAERQQYRRYMELSFIGVGVIYLLNVVDAAVDAHLFNFDLSDDLSASYQPSIQLNNNKITAGINFSVRLNPKKK